MAFLLETGTLEEAERLGRKVLETRTRVSGRSHPDTLISMSNLAETYRALGQLDRAKLLQREAIQLGEKQLGSGHPISLSAKFYLAFCQLQSNETQSAMEMLAELSEPLKAAWGPQNPYTRICQGLSRPKSQDRIGEVLKALLSKQREETLAPLSRRMCSTASLSSPQKFLLQMLRKSIPECISEYKFRVVQTLQSHARVDKLSKLSGHNHCSSMIEWPLIRSRKRHVNSLFSCGLRGLAALDST